jgi:hypothetical protein
VCADDDAEWASDVYDDAAYGDVPLSPLVVALPSPSSESASGSESAPSTPASAVFDDQLHSTDALDELEYTSGSEYGYGYGYRCNEGGDDAESDWEPSPSYGYTGWHTRPAPSSSTAFTPPQQQLVLLDALLRALGTRGALAEARRVRDCETVLPTQYVAQVVVQGQGFCLQHQREPH